MRRVRLLHHNVQGCAGGFDPLLEQIRAQAPDVVCLNEVRKVQAKAFARALGKEFRWSGRWGHRIANAIFAPQVEGARVLRFPRAKGLARRSAVLVRWGGIDWVSTHMSLDAAERLRHLPVLLDILGEQTVLAADMNERPDGPVWQELRARLRDAGPDGPTWPAEEPRIRIDTVWCAPGMRAEATLLPGGGSDHLGIVVDLTIP